MQMEINDPVNIQPYFPSAFVSVNGESIQPADNLIVHLKGRIYGDSFKAKDKPWTMLLHPLTRTIKVSCLSRFLLLLLQP